MLLRSFELISAEQVFVVCWFSLKRFCEGSCLGGLTGLESVNGRFLVYASGSGHRSVSLAVRRMAKNLRMSVRVVRVRQKEVPIYVYYQWGEDEAIPIFCDGLEKLRVEDVYSKLRSMMFVLSFHPKHLVLRSLRSEIMRFS